MNGISDQQNMHISYIFNFPNGVEKEFGVELEKDDLQIIRKSGIEYPDWAKLSNFKCPNCPLDETKNELCPLAMNLVEILREFKTMPSFANAEVTVKTPSRTYFKDTSLQTGVSSLLGILMVSSGCPIMGKLKPLLYFHLPFATLEDTQIRVLSLYLLSQYVAWKRGRHPDWEMNDLVNIYEEIRVLNHSVSRKIANLEEMDTSINSLIILNNFADYVTFTLDERLIDEVEYFLKGFLA